MMNDPASGPITVDELKALADAPYGKAGETLRKHDPLWGRFSGDLDDPAPIRKWRVFVTQEVTMEAYVTVEARTEEEACEIAECLPAGEFSWDHNSSGGVWANHAEPK
jgi:hypothetical protein